MALFPDGAAYKPLLEGYESGEMENVRRVPPEAGRSQKRDVWGVTKFFAAMEMDLDLPYANTVFTFWRDNRASNFDFYDFDTNSFTTESIGTGDGTTTTFTIDAKETSSQSVYVAGVLKTAGVHYTISAGTGTLGQDRVVFTAGNIPTAGQAITITYTGRHHYECEWEGPPRRTPANSRGRKHLSIRLREAF